jgi:hypothetical protein
MPVGIPKREMGGQAVGEISRTRVNECFIPIPARRRSEMRQVEDAPNERYQCKGQEEKSVAGVTLVPSLEHVQEMTLWWRLGDFHRRIAELISSIGNAEWSIYDSFLASVENLHKFVDEEDSG